jgi:hypothetical protein
MAKAGRKPSIEKIVSRTFKLPLEDMERFKKHVGKYQQTKVLIQIIKAWLAEKEVPCKK